MWESVKSLDLLGNRFQLQVKGNRTYKTKVGGFVTLLNFLIISFGIYHIMAGYFDSSKPRISISNLPSESYPFMDLMDSKIIPAIILINRTGIVPLSNIGKYATIFAQITTYKKIGDIDDLEIEDQKMLNFIPCSTIKNETIIKLIKKARKQDQTEDALSFFEKFALCLDFEKNYGNWFIQGNQYQTPYTQIKIIVLPCSLATTTDCVTLSEIVETKFKFGLGEKLIDWTKKKNPIDNVMNIDSELYLHPGELQSLSFFFKHNEVIDFDTDFRDGKKTYSYIDKEKAVQTNGYRVKDQVHCTPIEIMSLDCAPYIILSLKSGSRFRTVERKYPKLISSIGEVGGFIELIILVSTLLYSYYNNSLKEKYLSNKILGHSEHEISKIFKLNKKVVKEDSKKIIQKNIDSVNIIRKISIMKVIRSVMFEDHHMKLAPLILIMQEMEKSRTVVIHSKRKEQHFRKLNGKKNFIKNKISKEINKLFEIFNSNTFNNEEVKMKKLVKKNPTKTISNNKVAPAEFNFGIKNFDGQVIDLSSSKKKKRKS